MRKELLSQNLNKMWGLLAVQLDYGGSNSEPRKLKNTPFNLHEIGRKKHTQNTTIVLEVL